MSPYFREEDVPEPMCEGSFVELNWKGSWNDPARPKEIVCSVCGVKLKPDFEEDEPGVFFMYMPHHYPGEA